jgi:AraC-like DNA-binding protein
MSQLTAETVEGGVVGIVSELRDAAGVTLASALNLAGSAASALPVVASVTPGAATGRDLLELIDRPRFRITLAGFHPLDGVLADFGSGDESSVLQNRILSRLLHRDPARVTPEIVAPIIIGIRRAFVTDLASACGLSGRSLHRRLAAGGFPSARALLAHVLILRTLWLVEREDAPLKRIAPQLGFHSPDALSNFVHRCTGHSVRALDSHGGFDTLLADLTTRIGSARSGSKSTMRIA